MNSEDFDRYLSGRLCWIDEAPTRASSARQRQCPQCRRKWSYDRLRKRWEAAIALASGKTRHEAADKLGLDIHTTGRLYAMMEDNLAGHFILSLKRHEGLPGVSDEEVVRTVSKMKRLGTPGAQHRCLVELGLRHLTAGERLDLIYRLCFRQEVRDMLARRRLGRTS